MGPADAFFEALRKRDRALVMGVVNATPDSFSDGGAALLPDDAAAAARRMAAEGAAIVDLGGESTRPGAAPVDEATETLRVVPVLERLRGEMPLSIDTRRATVARRALDLGAALVNDVTAGGDPAMLPLVAARGAGIVLMHMRGDPATMQDAPSYGDVVSEVEAFLLARAGDAARAGVPKDRILIDPGIGFGKRLPHNMALLAALPRLASHGWPVVVGVSRKGFLGELTGRPQGGRRDGTTAAVALAAFHGTAVVRVHDVSPARDAVALAQAYRGALLEL
jgi:dihydropteroate synthase